MTGGTDGSAAQKLSPEHRKYVASETAVAVVINSVLSLAFALLVSKGLDRIPLFGAPGMAVDFVPQCFMITFATTLAATLLTRKRLRAGKVSPLPAQAGILSGVLRNAFVRAIVFGLAVAVLTAPLSALVLYALGVDSLTTVAFVGMKVAYGAALALLVAPPIIRAALASPSTPS